MKLFGSKPLFQKIVKCKSCGAKAASIQITQKYLLNYSGPGGASGDLQISREDAALIREVLTEPINAEKLKSRFYDRAGLCPQCNSFYCGKCWNISSTGYGTCPKGHGASLDPHWSPE
jgi:hypothetical protein